MMSHNVLHADRQGRTIRKILEMRPRQVMEVSYVKNGKSKVLVLKCIENMEME